MNAIWRKKRQKQLQEAAYQHAEPQPTPRGHFDSSQKHFAQLSKTLLIAGTNAFESKQHTSAGYRSHRQSLPVTPSERPHGIFTGTPLQLRRPSGRVLRASRSAAAEISFLFIRLFQRYLLNLHPHTEYIFYLKDYERFRTE
ncbi:MAG: hypothetical protein J6K19_03055 [Prevotella sp.]|nr:hypothetical protein [Prevotella sp.]